VRPLDDVEAFGVPVALLSEHLTAYYGLPCVAAERGGPPRLTTRTGALGQPQDLTTDVLDWLRGERPSDTYGVIAVTTRDLYPEASWNFVFGQAGLRDGTGVFSFARMEPRFPLPRDPGPRTPDERALVLRRCLKVVTHEVGHMFGMEHCIERRCLLNGSNHVAEMDAQPLHLCPTCLRKVVHATRVEPLARYRALEAFYRRVNLGAEADSVAGRPPRSPSRPPAGR
jgi:archaemetzincin